ncbi:Gfo/Idh/MocA family protein [Nonomuraea angiospora]|uniref:Gfo/Idh/MocA family protein n=1 Tax=Nonomuraea angiospora TaxID=46172 RepID=UPI0029B322FE|nr:Gfo/Idh/MocA family oxidoreductase [Nonomuraea angiospora]MDX3108655.1 Gfo/Idh/MocA family oxidoreductase [Nonomuraea angiospora]
MSGPVGFGVIGCGSYGRVHAELISSLGPDLRLVAVADAETARAADVAARLGCAASRDLEELYGRQDVDAVTVCVPHGLHADVVVAALEAGKHVLVEKPLEIDLESAERIVEAERRSGRVVGVMSQRRFEPAARAAADRVAAGELGRLTGGLAHTVAWRDQEYYDATAWRGSLEVEGGGALMTLGVHALDLLLWLLGDPVEAQAQAGCLAHERIEVEDTIVGSIRFASGAIAGITATTAAYPGLPPRVAVFGDRGTVVIPVDPDERAAVRAQYHDFVAAMANGRKPLVDTDAGLRVLATVLALYESARTGKAVPVAWT